MVPGPFRNAVALLPLVLLGAAFLPVVSACGNTPTSISAPGDAATSDQTSPPSDASDAALSSNDAGWDSGATAPPLPVDAGDAGEAAAPLGKLIAYASGYGPNIDVFSIDPSTGALSLASSVAAFGTAPSFLAINREVTHLYAVDENTPGRVGAYAIDPATGALTFQNAVSSGGNGPPFVSLDRSEAYVLVANYGDGTVSVLPIQSDGSLASPASTLTVGANAHMIVTDPSNQFVFVPCLGADYVAQFLFDPSTGTLTPNAVPHVDAAADAGPRHLAFHPNGKLVYLVNETNSTMTVYTLDPVAGTLTEIQTLSTVPAGFTGTNTAAEVWVHPSGDWVLASNRGDDSLVVFAVDPQSGKLSPAGFTSSGGTTPRDFTLDPTGTLVYAANQGTGNVVPFRFDATAGSLATTASAVSVAAASFVGIVRLPE